MPSPVRSFTLVGLLAAATHAHAEDDPFGSWAPADGSPITARVAARIPEDGAICIDEAVRRASHSVKFEIDQLTSGATMELDRYQEPFALCMAEKGWHRVDADELAARRVLGEIADCRAGLRSSCASAIVQHVHGIPGSTLDAPAGMAIAGQLCDGGDMSVCLTAASLALQPPEGRGVAPSPRIALSFATRGCEGGDGESCGFAGALLSTGAEGLPADTTRGGKYLARACAKGVASACNWPHGAVVNLADASLPAQAEWCRYAASAPPLGRCQAPAVVWVASPLAAACAPTVTVTLGACAFDYRLGR